MSMSYHSKLNTLATLGHLYVLISLKIHCISETLLWILINQHLATLPPMGLCKMLMCGCSTGKMWMTRSADSVRILPSIRLPLMFDQSVLKVIPGHCTLIVR